MRPFCNLLCLEKGRHTSACAARFATWEKTRDEKEKQRMLPYNGYVHVPEVKKREEIMARVKSGVRVKFDKITSRTEAVSDIIDAIRYATMVQPPPNPYGPRPPQLRIGSSPKPAEQAAATHDDCCICFGPVSPKCPKHNKK